jgi:hypothetical protein
MTPTRLSPPTGNPFAGCQTPSHIKSDQDILTHRCLRSQRLLQADDGLRNLHNVLQENNKILAKVASWGAIM